MAAHFCSAVPPYILDALAASSDPELRDIATSTIQVTQTCHAERQGLFQVSRAHRFRQEDDENGQDAVQPIVPEYLLDRVARSQQIDEDTQASAQDTLAISQQLREERAAAAQADVGSTSFKTTASGAHPKFTREIYDMQHKSQMLALPGKVARREGQNGPADVAVNEAYDNALKVLEFFWDLFGYSSVDGKNMKIISSVHYGKAYANAAWYSNRTGTIRQMIYGDGDNKVLGRFTKALDVIGHEITHGITEFNSHLIYQGESGALNEHLSDVFGVMVKQKSEGKTAEQADWLIGEACFMPDIKGVAFRNMLHPGTAFKDLGDLGSDLQPDHYSKIPEVTEANAERVENDGGGVHIFSGIPNRAFALSALAFGGNAWDKAGKIWWNACITHRDRIPQSCSFLQFADVTVDSAKELYGVDDAKVVRGAWETVGVVREA